jgi:hypothetical protein
MENPAFLIALPDQENSHTEYGIASIGSACLTLFNSSATIFHYPFKIAL